MIREIRTASHHLDTSKRLLACCQYLFTQRPEARMLTLLEADGCSQLQDEWGGTQDPLLIEIVSNLQCVPFGCRVAPFLVELAEQRAAKGCEVAIISNDVDIVVASRVANGAKWRHLGFMFVDAEFLLPGLAQIEPKLASFVTSCGLKQATSGNMRQAPSPKPA